MPEIKNIKSEITSRAQNMPRCNNSFSRTVLVNWTYMCKWYFNGGALDHWSSQSNTWRAQKYDGSYENKFTWRIFVYKETWAIPHAALIWRRAIVYCCPVLEQNNGGRKFKDQREVGADVTRWLVTQGTEWYRQGKEKLVPRCDKCLSTGDVCVETW
jgi:hypothetical protein